MDPLQGLSESVHSSLSDPPFARLQDAFASADPGAVEPAVREYRDLLAMLAAMHNARAEDAGAVNAEIAREERVLADLQAGVDAGVAELDRLREELHRDHDLTALIRESFEVPEEAQLENGTVSLDMSPSVAEYDAQIAALRQQERDSAARAEEHLAILTKYTEDAERMCAETEKFRALLLQRDIKTRTPGKGEARVSDVDGGESDDASRMGRLSASRSQTPDLGFDAEAEVSDGGVGEYENYSLDESARDAEAAARADELEDLQNEQQADAAREYARGHLPAPELGSSVESGDVAP